MCVFYLEGRVALFGSGLGCMLLRSGGVCCMRCAGRELERQGDMRVWKGSFYRLEED